MKTVDTIPDFRAARRDLSGTVGLVPTMGYLHAGHLSLVEAARAECDSIIATIFVNPTQFGAGEDLETYPRDLPRDLEMLKDAGVDLVFFPSSEMMYPPRFQTWVSVEEVTRGKEGGTRPGHFRGVTTIVAKLFNLTQPDIVFFGQKDAQQVAVIRQMVRDLNFPLDVQVCPIVREHDGLALSSRNVYLSPAERETATVLSRSLGVCGELYEAGVRDPEKLREQMFAILQEEALATVDYVSIADAATLEEVTTPIESPLLVSLAVQIGKPRLLDNCLLPMHLNTREGATNSLGTG